MEKKINFFEIVYIFLFLLMLITSLFNLNFLGYVDEMCSIVCFFYFLFCYLVYKEKKLNFLIWGLILLIIIGLLGNAFNSYEKVSLKNILFSIFMFLKPFFFLLGSYCFFKRHNSSTIKKVLRFVMKITLIIIFFAGISFVMKNGLLVDSHNRFSFSSGFSGATANVCIICVFIILTKVSKINLLYCTIALFSIYLTNSSLALLGIVIILFFHILGSIRNFKFYYLLPVLVIVAYLFWDEFANYILNSNTARGLMYKYAFVNANNSFPIGSGFGTYGSYVAANNYSYLYLQYNFQNVWGLGINDAKSANNFLFDTYYPMIIGEFGYTGLITYLLCIFIGFKRLLKLYCLRNEFKLIIALLIYVAVMGIGFNLGGIDSCILFSILFLIPSEEGNIKIAVNAEYQIE